MRRLLALFLLVSGQSCLAAYVTPQMGGGSVGQASAPMKHADIHLFGQQLLVSLDNSIATPELRGLTPPDEFDPNQPWNVLNDKAYNFQFGWNLGGFIPLPFDTGIWIEQTDSSPELEIYDRSPATLGYEPIFGTNDSSKKWQWSGSMTHNVYAVANPQKENYFAEYLVYVGDSDTGTAIESYLPTTVRFNFVFDLPLQGDYNQDGSVTAEDYQVWVDQFGQSGDSLVADGNQDGLVNAADFTIWRDNYATTDIGLAISVPEPASYLLTFSWYMTITALTLRRAPANI